MDKLTPGDRVIWMRQSHDGSVDPVRAEIVRVLWWGVKIRVWRVKEGVREAVTKTVRRYAIVERPTGDSTSSASLPGPPVSPPDEGGQPGAASSAD